MLGEHQHKCRFVSKVRCATRGIHGEARAMQRMRIGLSRCPRELPKLRRASVRCFGSESPNQARCNCVSRFAKLITDCQHKSERGALSLGEVGG